MPSASERPAILIVDDEPNFRAVVREGLASSQAGVEVLTAANGVEALRILRQRRIQLVVTDLQMPEMSGFELLAQMVREFPGLPAIVMTAFGAPVVEDRVNAAGAVAYLEKPIDFRQLSDRIAAQLDRSARGRLRGVSLASFLQLLEVERKTCSIDLACGGQVGSLYFDAGTLIDAELGELVGEPAFYAILLVSGAPEIEIDELCRSQEQRIRRPLAHLLLDAARERDEAGREADADYFDDLEEMPGTLAPVGEGHAGDHLPREAVMRALNRVRFLYGALGMAVIDLETGACLEATTNEGSLDLPAAARAQAAVLRAELDACRAQGFELPLEDVVISLSRQQHLLRPISATRSLVLYLIVDRRSANLAMARLELKEIERTLCLAVGSLALH